MNKYAYDYRDTLREYSISGELKCLTDNEINKISDNLDHAKRARRNRDVEICEIIKALKAKLAMAKAKLATALDD